MDIISRLQAADLNRSKYYTGRPCKRGHLTLRYVNTGACIECVAGYSKDIKAKIRDLQKNFPRKVLVEIDHLDDIPSLRAFAEALNFERKLKK